jgi:uncharacterized protein YbaR (Trm112 family)
MPRLLHRLGQKLLCQIACHGKTLVHRDARAGTITTTVVCTRCGRVLEIEEMRLLPDAARDRRVA